MTKSKVMRTAVVIILSCILVASATTVVLAQEQQESEPNDAQGAATTIEGTKVKGEIGSSGDTDWYAFEAEEDEDISILATGDSPDTTVFFSLVGPNGDTLADTDLGYDDSRGQIATTAPESGTYYLEVSTVSDVEEIPYTITVPSASDDSADTSTSTSTSTTTQTPTDTTPTATATQDSSQEQPQQESEPNDAQGAATVIEGAKIKGEIGSSGDTDWYAFEAEEGEDVSILATGDSPDATVFFSLVGPNGDTLADTDLGYDDSRGQIATTAPESGTYYIEVSTVSDIEGIPYTITISSASDVSTNTSTSTSTATPTVTPTPTPTPTQTQTPLPTTQTQTDLATTTMQSNASDDRKTANETAAGENGSGGSSAFGPGFGPVVALVALLTAALLATHRLEQ